MEYFPHLLSNRSTLFNRFYNFTTNVYIHTICYMLRERMYERIRDIIGSSKEKYNSISEKFQRVYRFIRKKKKKQKRTHK